MKITNSRRELALFAYCSLVVLTIVSGQSTTDDDIDKDEITELRTRIEILERQLSVMIANKPEDNRGCACKFRYAMLA